MPLRERSPGAGKLAQETNHALRSCEHMKWHATPTHMVEGWKHMLVVAGEVNGGT
jgi:hypothetical protein